MNSTPETPRDILYKAFKDLWIDRLSFATGKIVAIDDGVVINHRVSIYAGASGGPLLDEKGNIIGNILMVPLLSHRSPFERRISIQHNTKMIITSACNNVAVSLDGPQMKTFLKYVVAPGLHPRVRGMLAGI
jgi:hypothetical protein